jgi:hypothetical protein
MKVLRHPSEQTQKNHEQHQLGVMVGSQVPCECRFCVVATSVIAAQERVKLLPLVTERTFTINALDVTLICFCFSNVTSVYK